MNKVDNKITSAMKYIFSVYNFRGRDTGLHFFIKTWITLVFMILFFIPLSMLAAVIYPILGGDPLKILMINIGLMVVHGLYLSLSLASRRFRDIGRSQWIMIVYILSFFTGILGVLYWLHLCFVKSTQSEELVVNTPENNL